MSLDKALYQQIREDAEVKEFEINGRKYTSKSLVALPDPQPEPLQVSTLTGLIDYLNFAKELKGKEVFCHIETPTRVYVRTHLHGTFCQRSTFIKAIANIPNIPFNDFVNINRFIIILQSNFIDNSDRADLLRYVGNIRSSEIKTVSDDGVSQEITTKTGTATVANVILPNPVTLRPYRTFNEIEQLESTFICRGQKDGDTPKFALFEADNGAWQLEAMESIKKYLQNQIPELCVIA